MSTQETFSWNKQYLIKNGKPWLPMMGEFHYARYPEGEWKQEIYKMKALGVDIVATYSFWIHHEEKENVFDFSGRRCLRKFITACKECGVYVWLRIGPWCHGETRNGGFPDWLMQKGIPLRCNQDAFFAYVRRYWKQLFEQVRGMMYRDGGPIIGIQLDNEYGHCGGEGDPAYMARLMKEAKEIGFVTPYYTATGWGGAEIGEALPVMACYCDAPWDPSLAPLPPSPNYIFSAERNDVDVGSDFERGTHVSFNEDDYPYLLAEMGGGIGATFHRRPTDIPADTGAMTLVKLGSGANLLGYYMFHGGTNPGQNLNETQESGSFCETPVLSYAPHSPIGEFGQIEDLGKEIKRIALFAHSFGEKLAEIPVILPKEGAAHPTDAESPRYALRIKDEEGFLFVNNYQRSLALPDRTFTPEGLPEVRIKGGSYGIFPVRLPVGKARISSENATPLCLLGEKTIVLWSDEKPEYRIEGEQDDVKVITLTGREALDAWQDGEKLYISSQPVIRDEGGLYVEARHSGEIRILPEDRKLAFTVPEAHPEVSWQRIHYNYLCCDYRLDLKYSGEMDECYLRIDCEGALAELFVDGEKVADDTCVGVPFEIALKRYHYPKQAVLRVYALLEGMPVWMQNPPTFHRGRALSVKSIVMENSYKMNFGGGAEQ